MVKHTEKPAEKVPRAKKSKKKQLCVDCDQEFDKRTDLQQHRREKHKKKNVCSLCKKTFDTAKRLKMHTQFHNTGGEYECFYCDKQFNKAWKMKIHLVNHSGRPSFICSICGDDFLYPGKLTAHLKHVHDVYWTCRDCGDIYEFDDHMCKVYGCKDCLRCFSSKAQLAVHVKLHTMKTDNSDDDIQAIDLTEAGSPHNPPTLQPTVSSSQSVSNKDQPTLDLKQAQSHAQFETPLQVQGPENIHPANSKRKVIVKFLNFGTREHTKAVADNESHTKAVADNESHTKAVADNESHTHTGKTLSSEPEKLEDTKEGLNVNLIVPDSIDKEHGTVPVWNDVEIKVEDIKVEAIKQEDLSHDPYSSFDASMEHNGLEGNQSTDDCEPPKPSLDSLGEFKVPEATVNRWIKCENSVQKSLGTKKERNQCAKNREKLLSKFHLFQSATTSLNQHDKVSFESWLTSEGHSNPNHDFVFGCESRSADEKQEKEPHDFSKCVPKKEEMEMTFEDLCQF